MNRAEARSLIVQTFTQAFDKGRFGAFVVNVLNHIDESKASAWNSQYVEDAFKEHVNRYERLGTYTSPEKEKLDILIVHLTQASKLERTRTAIRNFVADHLRTRDEKDAALVAFVSPSEKQWRFSYVKMDYASVLKESGKVGVETRLTPARRFSYLVGEGESCHTAQTRFVSLLEDGGTNPALKDIEEAFSVEAVTKEFFGKYADLFESIHSALNKIIAAQAHVRDEFNKKGVNSVDFAKKLMGQIVFLYFLQKKGWLGVSKGSEWGSGPHDFLRRLAKGEYGKYDSFFNDILEPLFYDTLATDRGHEAWCNHFKCRIPFLNGGLFEPSGDYHWRKVDILLPNHLFSNNKFVEEGVSGTGVLDVFDRYNFTVNEAEPLEKEVAIDPEMLGKVFENLIEENLRKGLGAYYTPREIVHYMCQQSLINYLDTALNSDRKTISRADVEIFVHLGEQISHYEAVETKYAVKMPKSIEQHARQIDETLAAITVCDPAVGSGAFPVGMMTEIVRCRCALTPYFNDYHERSPYNFKRHAIQNCLYGVDIDPGAVEIAKLRLWLSLVVDEEETKQIKPLPNLDYKIVSGNSLIGFPFKSRRLQEIEKLKLQFFDEVDHEVKSQLKRRIDIKLKECFTESKQTLGYEVNFDFGVYFSEVFDKNRGFDVLIGNPPYGVDFDDIQKAYIRRTFTSYKYKYESYVYFIERALGLAKNGGCVSYITPELWLKLENCAPLRRVIADNAGLRLLRVCGEDVFEQAVVNTVVFLLQKATDVDSIRVERRSEVWHLPSNVWRAEPLLVVDYRLRPELGGLVSKVKTTSSSLSDYGEAIQGITPYDRYRGQDPALIKRRGYHFTERHDAHCGKWLSGGDITRYALHWSGEWLKYGPWLGAPREPRFFEGPRLLFREIPGEGKRIQATFVLKETFYHGHSITPFKMRDNVEVDIKFLLGVVNSQLISWFGGLTLPNFGKDIFPKINPQDVKALPVPRLDFSNPAHKSRHDKIARLAERILAAKQRGAGADTTEWERDIDWLVYELYGLTPDEIKLVEKSTH
jgi:hypothetical protein